MYMNGRGILKRTDEVNDDLWAALPWALAGSYVIVLGIGLSWTFLLMRMSWDPPLASWKWLAFAGISLASIAIGAPMICRWFRALRINRAHRAAMERETAARGRGWALD